MAAAAIAVESSTYDAMYDLAKPVYGRFEVLATVQLLGTTDEMEVFVRRRDHQVQKVEQIAGITRRAWTVQ